MQFRSRLFSLFIIIALVPYAYLAVLPQQQKQQVAFLAKGAALAGNAHPAAGLQFFVKKSVGLGDPPELPLPRSLSELHSEDSRSLENEVDENHMNTVDDDTKVHLVIGSVENHVSNEHGSKGHTRREVRRSRQNKPKHNPVEARHRHHYIELPFHMHKHHHGDSILVIGHGHHHYHRDISLETRKQQSSSLGMPLEESQSSQKQYRAVGTHPNASHDPPPNANSGTKQPGIHTGQGSHNTGALTHKHVTRDHHDHEDVEIVEMDADPDVVVLDEHHGHHRHGHHGHHEHHKGGHSHNHVHSHGGDVTIVDNSDGHSHDHIHSHGGDVKIIEDGHGHSHNHVHVHNRQLPDLQGPLSVIPAGSMPGNIDVMSPTFNNPVGKRIARLVLSTEPSELNQFIINASTGTASTVYLVVKQGATPLQDGTLPATLQIPVLDKGRASIVAFCATFDPSQASPLMAAECVKDELNAVTSHSSQTFSYDTITGVIKPLWLAESPLGEDGLPNLPVGPDSTPPLPVQPLGKDVVKETQPLLSPPSELVGMQMAQGGVAPCSGQEEPDVMNAAGAAETVPSSSTPSPPQNVALVFVPIMPPSIPVVNAEAQSDESDDVSAEVPTQAISSTTLASPTDSSTGSEASTSTEFDTSTMTGSVTIVAGPNVKSTVPAQPSLQTPARRSSYATPNHEYPRDSHEGRSEIAEGKLRADNDGHRLHKRRIPDTESEEELALRPIDTPYTWKFNPGTGPVAISGLEQ